jgi:hypothetical protein
VSFTTSAEKLPSLTDQEERSQHFEGPATTSFAHFTNVNVHLSTTDHAIKLASSEPSVGAA